MSTIAAEPVLTSGGLTPARSLLAPAQDVAAPFLRVIERCGFVLGKITCRPGLQTYCGTVVRCTGETVWTRGESGIEVAHHTSSGALPSVYKSDAPLSEVIWKTARNHSIAS